MEHYCIPEYADVHEFLSHVATRTGKLKKGTRLGPALLQEFVCMKYVIELPAPEWPPAGGIPNVDAAARCVLRDWNTYVSAIVLCS